MASFWEKVRAWLEGDEPEEPAQDEAGEGVLDRDGFAALVLEAAAAVGVTELAYDPDDFCLRGPEGAVSWLHNRYGEYLRCPAEDRPRLLEAWAAQLVPNAGEVSHDWATAAPRLRPRIRSRFFLEGVSLSMQVEGQRQRQLPWLPLADDLVVTPVYDLPTMMSTVSEEDVAAWGVDLEQVMQVATDNLRHSEEPVAVATLGEGVRIVHTGDDYDSSRLLLPELLSELDLPPDIVALPATRSHLFLATASDPEALGMLLELARRVRDEPRLETVQPIVYRRGTWQTWLPPRDLPSRADWMELILWGRACDYEQQAGLLRTLVQRSGLALAVAPFHVLDGESGPFAATTWHGGPALLPEVEEVVVVGPSGDQAVGVEWATLRRIAGRELRREPDRWPPRWRVAGPPSGALWQALCAECPVQGYGGDEPAQ